MSILIFPINPGSCTCLQLSAVGIRRNDRVLARQAFVQVAVSLGIYCMWVIG
jgi:hypothetical protein